MDETEYHVCDRNDYMFLLLDVSSQAIDTFKLGYIFLYIYSYKNGSLSRERIRNDCCEGSWDIFSQLLDMTPRGNFGNIGEVIISALQQMYGCG